MDYNNSHIRRRDKTEKVNHSAQRKTVGPEQASGVSRKSELANANWPLDMNMPLWRD